MSQPRAVPLLSSLPVRRSRRVWAVFGAILALALGVTPAVWAADSVPAVAHPYLTLEQLRAKYADPAGRIMNIDGVEVYYKDEGSGPAILMVHGSVSTLKTFDFIAPKLTKRYRVIRYDIPPLGLSGPISEEVAARVKPTDIPEKLLDRLGVKSATYVGVSSGGTMGIFLAAKRPDLINRLIIANTPSDPVDTSHLVENPEWIKTQAEAKAAHFQSQHFWDDFLSYFSGDPLRMTPSIRQQYYDFNRRTPEPHPTGLVAVVADHQKAVLAMSQVTAPTLLVWGARDPLLTPPTADILAGYLTHAQVSKLLLPDVGHYPPLEIPERYVTIIETYIETVTPGASVPTAGR